MLAHTETLFAATTERFIDYGGVVIPNTPLSFVVASYFFEYDWAFVCITFVISIAIQACMANLLATMFLFFHLAEKAFFTFEVDIPTVIVISSFNVIIAGFFTYKGIKILLKR